MQTTAVPTLSPCCWNGLVRVLGFVGGFLVALVTGVPVAVSQPYAYVTFATSDTVGIINTLSNRVVAGVHVGHEPVAIALTPDGRQAYVVNNRETQGVASVSVIDTASETVSTTIALNPVYAYDVAVTPDGSMTYVLNGNVVVLDTSMNTLRLPININQHGESFPYGMAITPDGRFAYIANTARLSISQYTYEIVVIDILTNTIRKTIPVQDTPSSIDISPDGLLAYVTTGATISILNLLFDEVTGAVSGDPGVPESVTFSPEGNRAYVAAYLSDVVSIVDTSTHRIVNSIPILSPIRVAFTPDGRFAYVTSAPSRRFPAQPGSDSVTVIDTQTETISTTIDTSLVGAGPYGIAITFGPFFQPSATTSPTTAPTPTASPTKARTLAKTETPVASTPTPSPIAPGACHGDCNGDRRVTVAELVASVNIALGRRQATACDAADTNHDTNVSIAELVAAVGSALHGCGGSQVSSRQMVNPADRSADIWKARRESRLGQGHHHRIRRLG